MQDPSESALRNELERLRAENARLKAAECQRDQAEAALRESERRYRHLVDHANDILYRADKGGHFTYFNPAAVRLMGYSAEEILGRLYLDLIHPDYRREAKKLYVRQIKEQIPNTYFEYPAVRKDGSLLWLGQNVQLVVERGEVTGIQAVARDITQRREAEIQLQRAYAELERRVAARTAELRAINESLKQEIAARQRAVERQRRLMQIAAAIPASTALTDILRMVYDAIMEVGGFDRCGVLLYDRETKALRGAWGTDRDGQPEDISHHVQFVREDHPSVTDLFEGRLDYLLSADYTAQHAVTPGDPMYGVHAHAAVPLRVGQEVVGIVSVDNLLRDAPITEQEVGELLPFVQLAAVALYNVRLFEELRQTQEALFHSEKLRAIGELASGVAHNVNNVLQSVMGYAELIPLAEGDPDVINAYAYTIMNAAAQGAEIVRRMQQFARKEMEPNREVFDLAEAAWDAIELTRPAWHNRAVGLGASIEVVTSLQPQMWVFGVASEIREVLVNLIKNAVDAMADGGTLSLRGSIENSQAVLEVADTGPGMEEAVRQRIFEPFFTTKRVGQGVGLGLSVAWGIVSRHQGSLTVQSAPGQGTVFYLRLPMTDQAVIGTKTEMRDPGLAGAHLLLVEDEEFVAGSLARGLQASGAVVAVASNAEQALRWLAAHSAECEIVVSDHGMAGLTGIELLRRVRDLYPHLRRVLLSGWGAQVPGDVDTSAVE
ncbi:MAG TPA: PAS domain S-box protein, partial [Chthonomonadaceae bacterium]|nr:PAS domain S-box protein [Chthonomonadaceae bacterium]